jgi:hypothetical protein
VFLVVAVVLSGLAVPLFGGRLGALVDLRLRHVWAIYGPTHRGRPGLGLHRVCGSRLVPRWTPP